ncbi:diaminopimelate decarboxylase [Saccharicrinis fermentans]|uniref:Diaminopimelate decarboxylase n=1 Tax=Saccharicrinis fermentans DSM 9555 = JCM 21142 TaxID=869213 RepID=W7Y4J7_9BACT|nr:diaminopimelate decarboxylase [Saccharicrinis fermentans]GAF05825.1 diaminopimelate decarboxylase [Saccharicrinis fermentans DSM 9555 = JCM 21142]
MSNPFPFQTLNEVETPFYYYNMQLLDTTLETIKREADKYGYHIHYAVKANANQRILERVHSYGFGADCVSGNEVIASLAAGFPSDKIVFAGVGKADKEIIVGLENNIGCFNVESIPELEVIDEIAKRMNKTAKVALRINPNVQANTHKYITTGLEENKFGIYIWDLEKVLDKVDQLNNIEFVGIHFHIGSQINDLDSFKQLCTRVNELQERFVKRRNIPRIVNVGGGLGVDYENPDENPMPDFEKFFGIFDDFLDLQEGQEVHFELGRSVVCQCGTLLSKVLYVKDGVHTQFAIVDAGMSDLIRPALYQAYHKIENQTSHKEEYKYDVVGPICESSDCFGKAVTLPKTERGDLIAIRSAGAYGEVMANQYNLRELPKAVYSDLI